MHANSFTPDPALVQRFSCLYAAYLIAARVLVSGQEQQDGLAYVLGLVPLLVGHIIPLLQIALVYVARVAKEPGLRLLRFDNGAISRLHRYCDKPS